MGMQQTTRRPAEWISPTLKDLLIAALTPIEAHKTGVPAHEVFINVGYAKAQRDIRNLLLHRTLIQLPAARD